MPQRSRLAMGFRALTHRNFQLFMSGQLISLIGTWMQNISQAWLVYQLTGSSLLLGVVGFSSQFPILLLGPVGGIVADRWNRHRVVIGTQAASMVLAFILAGLTLTGKIKVWEIITLSALLGCVNAFDIPARQTFLMDMVGREDLVSAIGLNSSMFNSARIIGPAIAGLLVASIGEGWCFFVNAVSYIAVIAGLLLMRLGPVVREETSASPLERVVEGFRFVRNTGPIFAPLLLLAIVSLVALPFSVLMPIFADRILHGGARGLGILMGATGVGAVLGALTLATRPGVRGLGRIVALRRRRLRYGADPVFGLALVLGVGGAAGASRLLHDAADGLYEHADPDSVARPPARTCHVRLLDDGHGNDAVRFVLRRGYRGTLRGSVNRGDRRTGMLSGHRLVRTPPAQVAQTGAGATGHRTNRWGSTVKGLKFQRSESATPGLSFFPLEKLVEFVRNLI